MIFLVWWFVFVLYGTNYIFIRICCKPNQINVIWGWGCWRGVQPQGDYIELHRKRNGYRHDHFQRKRKKEAREVHKRSQFAQKVPSFSPSLLSLPLCFSNSSMAKFSSFFHTSIFHFRQALGIKGKMFAKKRYAEKALMKKTYASPSLFTLIIFLSFFLVSTFLCYLHYLFMLTCNWIYTPPIWIFLLVRSF